MPPLGENQRFRPWRLRAALWFAVILACGWATLGSAQVQSGGDKFQIDMWDVPDGLPGNSVWAITQTVDGYLWLASTRGLARFNGASFRSYTTANTPALGCDSCVGLYLDDNQDLLVAPNSGGLVRVHGGEFRKIQEGWNWRQPVHFLAQTSPGNFWGTTREQFGDDPQVIRLVDGKWQSFPLEGELANSQFKRIARDSLGHVWLGTERCLAIERQGRFEPLPNMELRVDSLVARPGGGLWLAANGRIRSWRDGDWAEDLGDYLWNRSFVSTMLEDRRGNLWVATFGEGLFCHQKASRTWFKLTSADGLSDNRIRTIFEDREGTLWVGTEGGGIMRLVPRVFTSVNQQQGIFAGATWSVYSGPQGRLWWSTEFDGVYSRSEGRLYHDAPHLFPDLPHPIDVPIKASAIYEDRQRNLWLGTCGGGLLRKINGRYQPVENTAQSQPVISALLEDRLGDLWVGSETGLGQIHEGAWRLYTTNHGLASHNIKALAEDSEGNLWIGTTRGLYGRRRGEFTRFPLDPLDKTCITAMHTDPEGNLWIGTPSSNLCGYSGGRLVRYPAFDEKPSGAALWIVSDNNGGLWVATETGIYRASRSQLADYARGDAATTRWLSVGRSGQIPHLQSNPIAQPAACKTPDGLLWFATVKGIIMIDPRQVKLNELPPKVVIEQLLVDGQPAVLPGNSSTNDAGPVVIAPGHRRFEFQYAALSFVNPGKVRFKYALDGLDSHWTDLGSQRSVTYDRLRPGEYQFRLVACNSDGVWNLEGARLAFRVRPFFWQTGWFLAIAMLAAGSLVAGVARGVSHRRLKRSMERLRQRNLLELERRRIAEDLHDDLGGSLSKIALLGELAEVDADHPARVRKISHDIYSAARNSTRALEVIVWAATPEHDNLEGLVNYSAHYFRTFLQAADISFRLDAPEQMPSLALSAGDRHNLFLALKEAVHNIVKHARATEVTLRFYISSDDLEIMVQDNGRGFAPGDTPAACDSDGLRNLRQRLARLGGGLKVHSAPGQGTQVCFNLPLDRTSHFHGEPSR